MSLDLTQQQVETRANVDATWPWNDTAPTSSLFSVGNQTIANGPNGDGMTYIAYCFHSVDGYSKIGVYTGNAIADGTYVHTGFRPAWVMIKALNIHNWVIWNSGVSTYNQISAYLRSNTSEAEQTSSTELDFTSNGFKMRNTSEESNSGERGSNDRQFVFMAFAEIPFKYANAR
jgi:hypothetical protein